MPKLIIAKPIISLAIVILISLCAYAKPKPYIKPDTKLVVLCYHNMGSDKKAYTVSGPVFSKHLDLLVEQGFKFVNLQQVDDYYYNNKPLPPKSVVITFDDGNESTYLQAYPILKARKIPWTMFVYPTAIEAGPKRGFMNWSQVKEIASNGASIGCHTYWHPYLTSYKKEKDPEKWLKLQLVDSRRYIEEKTGKPVTTLAIPFGLSDETVAKHFGPAGYRLVFNIKNANNSKTTNPLDLNRQIIGGNESIEYLKSRILAF